MQVQIGTEIRIRVGLRSISRNCSAYNGAGFPTMFVLTRFVPSLLVLLIGLLAQALPTEGLVPVEGSVMNKLTGAPIKGAHVIYTRIASAADPAASPISRDSDLQGHFHLE